MNPASLPTSESRLLPSRAMERRVVTYLRISVACSTWLALAGCARTQPDVEPTSGSTHWVTCEQPTDCEVHRGAMCSEGYCVDELGRKLSEESAAPDSLTCGERTSAVYAAVEAFVSVADRACSDASDCKVVGTAPSCIDSCYQLTAVNSAGEASIGDNIEALEQTQCVEFQAASCQVSISGCTPPGTPQVACVAGECELSYAQPGECFSPSEHTAEAYSGDYPGCACSNVGSICVGGAALMCDQNRWVAVEDGPCYPTAETVCDGRVASPQLCVELFDTCREDAGGQFCGVGPRTNLCDAGTIVQNESDCDPAALTCAQLDNGLYCSTSATPADQCSVRRLSGTECIDPLTDLTGDEEECFELSALSDPCSGVHLLSVDPGPTPMAGDPANPTPVGDGGDGECPSAETLFWGDAGGTCGCFTVPACITPTVQRGTQCCYKARTLCRLC